jgi:hypothetical protein
MDGDECLPISLCNGDAPGRENTSEQPTCSLEVELGTGWRTHSLK